MKRNGETFNLIPVNLFFSKNHRNNINPLLHNVVAFAARFLKCVRPFYDIEK